MKIRIEPEALKAIENHVVQNHRCIFFVFGDEAKAKVNIFLSFWLNNHHVPIFQSCQFFKDSVIVASDEKMHQQ